jgi:pimeloyl-ACP methyl ester carboxylesterase
VRTTLVTIATPSTPLDGAWYEPDTQTGKARARQAALLFHGNTMNFYTGAPRFLPPHLARLGIAALAFNRRGHDILAIRDSRAAEGAAFQTYAEAIEDNRIAARWLAAQGFATPVVIGHSNGGMLAVRHAADHPQTAALVLLSAHCGGKDMLPRTCRAGLLAQDRLGELAEEAAWRAPRASSSSPTARTSWSWPRASAARCSTCAATRSRASSTRRRSSPGAAPGRARCRSCRGATTSTSAARR